LKNYDEKYRTLVSAGLLKQIRSLRLEIAQLEKNAILNRSSQCLENWVQIYNLQTQFNSLLGNTLMKTILQSKNEMSVATAFPKYWLEQICIDSKLKASVKRSNWKRLKWRINTSMKNLGKCILMMRKFFILEPKSDSFLDINKSYAFVLNHLGVQDNQLANAEKEKFTFVNWLNGKHIEVNEVIFCSEIEFLGMTLTCRTGPFGRLKIVCQASKLCVESWIGYLVKQRTPLSIFQALCYAIFMYTKANHKRNRIFWTESSGSVRPIWSYAAENFGVECSLVNFSNFGSLSAGGQQDDLDAQILLYTWSRYYACTVQQYNLLKQSAIPHFGNLRIAIWGVPWLSDSKTTFSPPKESYIAVFGYETARNHYGFSTMSELGFGSSESLLEFLTPILNIACELKILVLYKEKRFKPHSQLTDRQISIRGSLQVFSNLRLVAPETSAFQLFKYCRGAVSMPPTSTGIAAKQFGKNSIYFDPYGFVDKSDSSLDSVPVYSKVGDLKLWMSNL
jgi:hypothetical protein